MTFDPVERDLARYLADQEAADALDEAEQAKVEEWLADPERVREAWLERDEQEREDFANVLEDAMHAPAHVTDAERGAKVLAEALRQLRKLFAVAAPKAVQDDIDQARMDSDECAAESRAYSRAARYHGEE